MQILQDGRWIDQENSITSCLLLAYLRDTKPFNENFTNCISKADRDIMTLLNKKFELRQNYFSLGSYLVIFLAAVALISIRRPDQITNPEVWNEDGIFIIPQIIQGGFFSIFDPVNGYLIIPSRLITWLSLQVPLEYYAVVSTWLGVIAQAACITAVAMSPTALRLPLMCAALMTVLPMNAEVYVLPQYTFWWTTTLLFLGLIWKVGESPKTRNFFVILGGFSSPIIIVLFPLFLLRLTLTRLREDVIICATTALLSSVQVYFIILGDPTHTELLKFSDILPAITQFFAGWTIFSSGSNALVAGLTVLAILISGVFTLPSHEKPFYLLLGLVLVATIVSSMLRVPVEVISPTGNGPRYFFLPLVLISWMLAWLIGSQAKLALFSSFAIILIAVPVTKENYQRGQENIQSWAEAVALCQSGGYEMPIHHDGQVIHHHRVPYLKEWCN
jgi:hypothetical protein